MTRNESIKSPSVNMKFHFAILVLCAVLFGQLKADPAVPAVAVTDPVVTIVH